MKRKSSKILSVLLIGAMAMGIAACSKDVDSNSSSNPEAQNSDSDISVGIVVKTATNAHFQDIAYGAVLAGHDLGITVKVDNTESESQIEEQVTKCENLITAGVDAIILTPNDSSGVGGAVDAAHDAGIPFVTMDTEIDNLWGDSKAEYMPNFIGEDYEEVAYKLGKAVCEKMGGTGNVVILRGVDGASSSKQRTAGLERAISEYDGIQLIDSQSANYDQDQAVTTLADILQAHSDVDAVMCCNDLMAVGAVTALEENGFDVSENGVLVAGLDGNILALQSIKSGKMYATSYDYSFLQGYYGVEQAYALIKGEEVPEITLTPDVVITKDNVDEHLPHMEEVSSWNMGSAITEVTDATREYLNAAKALAEQ